jgi:hypothetical protein
MLVGATVGLGFVAAMVAAARLQVAVERGLVGIDYETYVAFARRFLETGSQFLPYQLAGPFVNQPLVAPELIPSTYPPTAMALFVPFIWLPTALWWLIPLGALGWSLATWRPDVAAWPFIAACLVWPETTTLVIVGNSTMWVVALFALGLRFGWPAALIVIKPSLAFAAFAGVRARSFWFVLGGVLVASLVMLPEWVRFFLVIKNGSVPLTYSLGSIPAVLIPLIAWLARADRPVANLWRPALGFAFARSR